MGFLDLGGSLGRKFGSIGVGIDEIATRLCLEPAARLEVTGPDAARARRAAQTMASNVGHELPARIYVEAAIPHHAGLGSGTQLALAIGLGLSRLHGLGFEPGDIAAMIGRGARSGIGIAVFEQGGLVVDAGRGDRTRIPPVIARLAMPPDWRFIIVLDQNDEGLHGVQEVEAFKSLPVFPAEEAARLCHLLLMRGLPAVLEKDIHAFGAVIAELQASVGDHFAPVQGGRFTSPRVRAALEFLADHGAVGIGQSSWGPTGFCLVESPAMAERLRQAVTANMGEGHGPRFLIGTPRQRGAELRVVPAGNEAI
jgi:beta-RFAP synthase